MGRDTLPAFPSHSFPYCYRKSYHFIDSLKPPVYWRFEAALPLQTAAASGCLFMPSCYGIISISGKKYRIAILVKIAILCWQREKDSNPHIRSQSPLCYHYTIPLCSLDEHLLLYQRFCICQELIGNFPNFFHLGRFHNEIGRSGRHPRGCSVRTDFVQRYMRRKRGSI